MLNKKIIIPILIYACMPLSFAGYEEGISALKKRNFELAFNEFNAAASGGNSEALIDLGLFYERGIVVDIDLKKAFELFKKAALLNVNNSYSFLADMYYKGIGTKQNFKKAFKWYLRAADNEHPSSTFLVSRMYEYGIGTEIDKDQAIVWYYKALGNHHLNPSMIIGAEKALNRLGIEYKHAHIELTDHH